MGKSVGTENGLDKILLIKDSGTMDMLKGKEFINLKMVLMSS